MALAHRSFIAAARSTQCWSSDFGRCLLACLAGGALQRCMAGTAAPAVLQISLNLIPAYSASVPQRYSKKHVHTWSSGGLQTHGPEVRTALFCWARPTYCDTVHESGTLHNLQIAMRPRSAVSTCFQLTALLLEWLLQHPDLPVVT